MYVLTAIVSILAGACFFAGASHLIAGVRLSYSRAHLAFALLALLSGAHALVFIWLHHAPDPAAYLEATRWGVSTGALTLAVLPWFVHFYTAAGRLWAPLIASIGYLAIALANLLLPFGLFFWAPPQLVHFELPWGEVVTSHAKLEPSWRGMTYWAWHVFAFTYCFHAARQQYLRGQRGQALALTASTAILALAMIANIAIAVMQLPSPFVAHFGFAALVLLMMFWLSSDEPFRALFERATEGIFIADRNGKYLDVNAAGVALLGYERAELRKLHVFDIVSPHQVASVQLDRTALLSGDVLRRELRFVRKDGSHFLGELSGRMLPDGRLLGIVRDLTEQDRMTRSLEERVAARTAEYAELNRQLESFAYSVSHDLRAPVRAISGFSSVLLEGEHAAALNAEGRRHLSRINAAAGHMNELIEGLLQLAQISHHKLRSERVDLGKLAHDVVQQLRERDPARKVHVSCPATLMAHGDARLLQVVVHNLIENAWKYTSRTSEASIEIGRQSTEEGEVYYVKDNGAGFDMQYAEHLFKPFQRLHSATEFVGAGVGLATVARVVERHGGRIWAEAKPDRGATFYFTLQDARRSPQHASSASYGSSA